MSCRSRTTHGPIILFDKCAISAFRTALLAIDGISNRPTTREEYNRKFPTGVRGKRAPGNIQKNSRCVVCNLRIGSCLARVYRVMDARGKLGEHERSVRVKLYTVSIQALSSSALKAFYKRFRDSWKTSKFGVVIARLYLQNLRHFVSIISKIRSIILA